MAKPETNPPEVKCSTISREEIVARLQDPTLAIVNVMPKATYDDGHIPGSINLPVADIAAQARRVIPDLAQEIAIYCMGPT
ncbi:MAG TPA: rhodanese-like domain-containing protein [Candidatus Binatia bacterium]